MATATLWPMASSWVSLNAIAVTKKRSGAHELTLRELRMDSQGISISEPLFDFQGVLTGVPTYHGEGDPRNQP